MQIHNWHLDCKKTSKSFSAGHTPLFGVEQCIRQENRMERPTDIFIKICNELDNLSMYLNEASSRLRWALEEAKIDQSKFSRLQTLDKQIDQTLDSIKDMYQIIWLIQSCNKIKARDY